MRRQRILGFALFALCSLVAPASAQAQQAQLRGTWNLNRQQSDDINVKINQSISRMNVVVRQIARPRLRSTNTPYPQLVFAVDGSNVRVDMAGRPSVSSQAGGQGVLWQRETGRTCNEVKGDCVRVTSRAANGGLEMSFEAEDGRRVNHYVLSPDGNTLTMNVTVTSPRLPQPLTYKLVYTRAS